MTAPSGVLLVDKPAGMTSHDVVARVRRRLGTRAVGHAGTLDPAATGLLVVLVEQATKLAPYLTAEDKAYVADIELGRATDTLDAEGQTVATAPVPEALAAELEAIARGLGSEGWPRLSRALEEERARTLQTPPVFSAIHVGGVRSHALARAGKASELEPRPVRLRSARVLGAATVTAPTVQIALEVEKGFYVRSFARDLGERLGVPAHLARLRRTSSGPFRVEDARPIESVESDALLPVTDAVRRCLPVVEVEAETERALRHGKAVPRPSEAPSGPLAAIGFSGDLVAIVQAEGESLRVLRGFSNP